MTQRSGLKYLADMVKHLPGPAFNDHQKLSTTQVFTNCGSSFLFSFLFSYLTERSKILRIKCTPETLIRSCALNGVYNVYIYSIFFIYNVITNVIHVISCGIVVECGMVVIYAMLAVYGSHLHLNFCI